MTANNEILMGFCAVLLTMLGFFLTAFFNRVDNIDKNLQNLRSTTAVRDEQYKNLDTRVTKIETTLQKSKNNLQ